MHGQDREDGPFGSSPGGMGGVQLAGLDGWLMAARLDGFPDRIRGSRETFCQGFRPGVGTGPRDGHGAPRGGRGCPRGGQEAHSRSSWDPGRLPRGEPRAAWILGGCQIFNYKSARFCVSAGRFWKSSSFMGWGAQPQGGRHGNHLENGAVSTRQRTTATRRSARARTIS